MGVVNDLDSEEFYLILTTGRDSDFEPGEPDNEYFVIYVSEEKIDFTLAPSDA